MNLNNKQKQQLKSLAHPLKPIVLLGNNGLTEGVLAEIEQALIHHELIKVRVTTAERTAKALIANAIIRETKAHQIQLIGSILILYRPNQERKILLPC